MGINVDITEEQMDKFLNSPEVKEVLDWVFEESTDVTSECEYCEGNNNEEIISETDEDVVVYKSGDMFRVDHRDTMCGVVSELFKFNHCPMCGKLL